MNAHQIVHQGNELPPHVVIKRGRGRPKGAKNKPKFDVAPTPTKDAATQKTFKAKSVPFQRKWQRGWVLPQFVLSRKQAQEILIKYLRSKPGKQALTTIVNDGFGGLSKFADNKLGEFLVSTNLLSRYPHEIVIRGN